MQADRKRERVNSYDDPVELVLVIDCKMQPVIQHGLRGCLWEDNCRK